MRLETLLNEISTFFINLPIEQLDSEIAVAQNRVCEFLNLDRSALFQFYEQDPQMVLTHIYQPSEIRTPPERMTGMEFFPWSLQKVMGGETLVISKMTDLPLKKGETK